MVTLCVSDPHILLRSPEFQVRETAVETGCEMNPAKRGINMNIRAIATLRSSLRYEARAV